MVTSNPKRISVAAGAVHIIVPLFSETQRVVYSCVYITPPFKSSTVTHHERQVSKIMNELIFSV
jgi:hypothetical protein